MSFIWNKNSKDKNVIYVIKDTNLWAGFVPIIDKPINYLEIGVLKGTNTLGVLTTYCKHPDSKLYCVDPWEDYDEYIEYKNQQDKNYNIFLSTVAYSGSVEKYVIKRGYSENIVPTFEDNFFDLVFIDGNHATEYVYRDGVMSLSKTKPGGYIVFDDYDWKETKLGIDKFLEDYSDKIKLLGNNYFQLFVQKL